MPGPTRSSGATARAGRQSLPPARRERQWPPHLNTLIVSAVSLACFGIATSTGILGAPHDRLQALGDLALRAAILVPALAVGWSMYLFGWRRLIASSGNEVDPPFQPDERWLADLQGRIGADSLALDKKGVLAFIDLLAYPARYRVRVAETIEFAERGLIQQVSVELGLPAPALRAKYLYLPVLLPLKGELLDNFRLFDHSGASLPNLSYDEATRLAAVGLRYLLATRGDSQNAVPTEMAAVDEIVLLGPVARRGRITPASAATEIDERIRALSIPLSLPTEERLRAYLTLLSVTYPVVVVVSPASTSAGRLLIKYERTLIPVSERKGLEGKLRLALGLRPHQVAIPVNLAYTAGSYHLRINGPADKFVFRQYLRCRHCGRLARRAWRGRTPAADSSSKCCHTDPEPGAATTRASHFRLRQRRGQSYVHLYMRGYADHDCPRDLEFLARLKEVPPGSLANAVATALVTTILIAVAGYISVRDPGQARSDVPALILALPVAAASWLGISEDAGKMVGSSLLARISLIASGFLSICAIIAYLAVTPGAATPAGAGSGAGSFAILGIHNWGWIALIGLSFLNLAYSAFRFAVRVTYYNYLRRKPSFDMAEYGS